MLIIWLQLLQTGYHDLSPVHLKIHLIAFLLLILLFQLLNVLVQNCKLGLFVLVLFCGKLFNFLLLLLLFVFIHLPLSFCNLASEVVLLLPTCDVVHVDVSYVFGVLTTQAAGAC